MSAKMTGAAVLRDPPSNNGSTAMQDLLASQRDEECLRRRRVESGQILLVDGRWHLSSRVVLSIGRCIGVVRRIMGLG